MRTQPAMTRDRFRAAIERIDASNAADPHTEHVAGQALPGGLLYGQRMTACLEALAPDAGEALRLAVRAQHLMRWRIPREHYPAGRKGYHQWRTALARFHAEEAARILRDAGYDEPLVARVQALLRKERLKWDADVQCLEDVACLVFLEHYLIEFMAKHPPDKVVDIVRKTWSKMSGQGQAAARELPLPDEARALVVRALQP